MNVWEDSDIAIVRPRLRETSMIVQLPAEGVIKPHSLYSSKIPHRAGIIVSHCQVHEHVTHAVCRFEIVSPGWISISSPPHARATAWGIQRWLRPHGPAPMPLQPDQPAVSRLPMGDEP